MGHVRFRGEARVNGSESDYPNDARDDNDGTLQMRLKVGKWGEIGWVLLT